MLSYQHAYHAGNLADVHKHALLAAMLDRLVRKDKPLTYIESHAGRGLYDLGSAEARKTGEAAAGIERVSGWFEADHPYSRVLAEVRARYGAAAYPGSPLLAALMLRPGDRLHLAELHPQEHPALVAAMSPFRVDIRREDGFAMARALTPPDPRRGLLLVDPSFEVKDDYRRMPGFLAEIHRKWNVGILVLWFPVLPGDPQGPMVAAMEAAFPGALRSEVRFPQLAPGKGMMGSGLFVVNPPFGIEAEAARLAGLFARLGS